MKMHATNLALALAAAIKSREELEQRMGYTGPSALLQGWRDVLAAIEREERVEVV